MKKVFVSLAGLILLAACATSQVVQNTAYACASATAALKVAIANDAKLTAAQRGQINRAVLVIDPVCSQPTTPTLDSTAQAALAGALSQLTAVATAVQ